jgi:hypothetical protein
LEVQLNSTVVNVASVDGVAGLTSTQNVAFSAAGSASDVILRQLDAVAFITEGGTATDAALVAASTFNVSFQASTLATDVLSANFLWNEIDDSQTVVWTTIAELTVSLVGTAYSYYDEKTASPPVTIPATTELDSYLILVESHQNKFRPPLRDGWTELASLHAGPGPVNPSFRYSYKKVSASDLGQQLDFWEHYFDMTQALFVVRAPFYGIQGLSLYNSAVQSYYTTTTIDVSAAQKPLIAITGVNRLYYPSDAIELTTVSSTGASRQGSVVDIQYLPAPSQHFSYGWMAWHPQDNVVEVKTTVSATPSTFRNTTLVVVNVELTNVQVPPRTEWSALDDTQPSTWQPIEQFP